MSTVLEGIPTENPPEKGAEMPFAKLIRLDSMVQPGLPEVEFRDLFTMCRQCRWVMTQKSFRYHECNLGEEQNIIDLTVDSD